jgi:hypothetical protein
MDFIYLMILLIGVKSAGRSVGRTFDHDRLPTLVESKNERSIPLASLCYEEKRNENKFLMFYDTGSKITI